MAGLDHTLQGLAAWQAFVHETEKAELGDGAVRMTSTLARSIIDFHNSAITQLANRADRYDADRRDLAGVRGISGGPSR